MPFLHCYTENVMTLTVHVNVNSEQAKESPISKSQTTANNTIFQTAIPHIPRTKQKLRRPGLLSLDLMHLIEAGTAEQDGLLGGGPDLSCDI